MIIAITVISILAISALVALVNRILSVTICPICAGSLITWVGLVTAHFAGYQVDLIVPALLMGGSVVGITYQLEKKFHDSSARTLLLWKVLFIPAGFVAAYAVLGQLWVVFLVAIVFLFLISFAFVSGGIAGPSLKTTGGLEKEMKDCC